MTSNAKDWRPCCDRPGTGPLLRQAWIQPLVANLLPACSFSIALGLGRETLLEKWVPMQISTSPKKLIRFADRVNRPASFKPTLEALEERTLLNAGALDQTFGMNGEVVTNFNASAFFGGSA
jgi:hypothetical protein